MLGPDDVLPGVRDVLRQVAVEPLFGDGSRFVLVADPIGGPGLGADAPGAVEPAPVDDAAAGRRGGARGRQRGARADRA